jgi:hypothetical protein
VAYPSAISEPSNADAYKLNGGDIETRHTNLPYIYEDCRVPFMRIESDLYTTRQEQSQTTQLLDGAAPVTLYLISGKDYVITFNQLIGEFAFSPSLPAGITLSGQQLEVNLPNDSAADGTTYTVEDSSTSDTWQFTVKVVNSANSEYGIPVSSLCDDDFVLCFYHPSRGWIVYPFKLERVEELTGNNPRIVQNAEERRAIAYEDIYEAVTVSATVSHEQVLNDLNTLNYCTQIYKVGITGAGATRSVDLSNAQRYFVEGGNSRLKSVKPFKAFDNVFSIRLISSTPINAINQ